MLCAGGALFQCSSKLCDLYAAGVAILAIPPRICEILYLPASILDYGCKSFQVNGDCPGSRGLMQDLTCAFGKKNIRRPTEAKNRLNSFRCDTVSCEVQKCVHLGYVNSDVAR